MFSRNLKSVVEVLECLSELSAVAAQHATEQFTTTPYDAGGTPALAVDNLARALESASLKHRVCY